ncbi:ATP synthase F1 subunit delta [Deferribacter autotrophicus]|uniref:ATP synthase F1 subunit delta n=1 Tax=Deferribacter autotrophicus TaxID=500465 RepID=UPI001FED57BC|nr:ATP synthase F1 subunit delta [Deferribacter autotrophicus]
MTIVAKRYANALYEYAKEKNNVEQILDELKSLVDLYESSADFQELVKNPLIKRSEKEKVFEELKNRNAISETLYNFLLMLTEKNRLNLIVEIYMHYRILLMEDRGEVDAYVKIADDYDDVLKKEIGDVLSKVTGKKVNLNIEIDKTILGGFVAQVKSNMYDASIKGQLRKLKETLLQV